MCCFEFSKICKQAFSGQCLNDDFRKAFFQVAFSCMSAYCISTYFEHNENSAKTLSIKDLKFEVISLSSLILRFLAAIFFKPLNIFTKCSIVDV